MNRCQWPDGMEIRPDGVNALDPCSYDVIEEHHGVTVRVLRCRNCGHEEIEWEDTGRWIPVSERLPEGRINVVLTFDYNGHAYLAGAIYSADGVFVDAYDWKQKYDPKGSFRPVAWMPLPEPYRKEEE